MTEDRLDVWDCRFCIASGKNIIWNARKDGNPRHDADREQLIQSWLTHQARCKSRQSADFAKRTSSTFSTSIVKRWAFEFMDTCVDDQGWFDKERAEVYLMERLGLVNPVPTKSSTSSNEDEGKQEQDGGNKKTEGADDNDIIKDGGQRYTRDCFYLEEGRLIDSKGRVWFPCILECAESSNDKRKLKAIKLIPSNEEGKQEGDLKQEEQEGVSKRQKQSSTRTEGDDNDI